MSAFRRIIFCDGRCVCDGGAGRSAPGTGAVLQRRRTPSVDPELMIRMLILGYCYGIRSERRLTQEVELHLAYRWFCKLDLEDEVPHHSTSDVLRHVLERVV
jgi:transposase